jgi:hypothetical protein
MRRIALLALVLVLAPGSTRAGTILYTTAATRNRIDGFCVARDGSLAATPTVQLQTIDEPRRLVVRGSVLYVAGKHQVVAYNILDRGGLKRIGATAPLSGMDPRDLAFSPAGNYLYVRIAADHIAAYTLDAEGAPARTCCSDALDTCDAARLCTTDDDCASDETCFDYPSCVQGAIIVGYLNLAVQGSLLYVTADGVPGRIDIHQIAADGSFLGRTSARDPLRPVGPSACRDPDPKAEKCLGGSQAGVSCTSDSQCPSSACGVKRPQRTIPISTRRRLQKPKALIVVGDMVYVEERALKRITAFQLQPDGTFCDTPLGEKTCVGGDENGEACGKDTDCPGGTCTAEQCLGGSQAGASCTSDSQCPGGVCGSDPGEPCVPILETKGCARRKAKREKRGQQCPASLTGEVLQYEDVVLAGETLLGTQYFKGRVDAYRLRPLDKHDPGSPRVRLPSGPTVSSARDVVMTPVRALANGDVLYVAAGERDQVLAYRLKKDTGVLASPTPFSRTAPQSDSFPNDVAVAVLPGPCD